MVASSNPRDRTAEFRQCYSSIANRSSLPKTATTAKGGAAGGAGGKQQQSKSEIARLAGGIARDINATTGKLQKLAQRESEFRSLGVGEGGGDEARGSDGEEGGRGRRWSRGVDPDLVRARRDISYAARVYESVLRRWFAA